MWLIITLHIIAVTVSVLVSIGIIRILMSICIMRMLVGYYTRGRR